MMSIIEEIQDERRRQINVERFSRSHDDQHVHGDLARAAACYAIEDTWPRSSPLRWPWAAHWWKPKTARENLIRAGALIVAEIERLDRARPDESA